MTPAERAALAVARQYRIPGMDPEDLRQEALVTAWQAEGTWDPSRGAKLATFTALCVHRRMGTLLRTATRESRKAEVVELQPWLEPGAEDGPSVSPLLANVRTLRPGQQRVLVMLAAGFTRNEIAKRERVAVGTIDTRLWEARLKLRRMAA